MDKNWLTIILIVGLAVLYGCHKGGLLEKWNIDLDNSSQISTILTGVVYVSDKFEKDLAVNAIKSIKQALDLMPGAESGKISLSDGINMLTNAVPDFNIKDIAMIKILVGDIYREVDSDELKFAKKIKAILEQTKVKLEILVAES